MQHPIELRGRLFRLLPAVGLAALAIFLVWGLISVAHADPSVPLDVGYLDFTYQPITGTLFDAPTGQKPESKLWWNDGFWWGSLYNRDADAYHIYWLDWGTQTWRDTGVALDDRRESKADTLWDAASNKLYVASHVFRFNSSQIIGSENWGRLYRYSYDEAAQSYSLDSGFPVTVNEDRTENLVLAKDSTGRLWVTYVSRPIGTNDFQVYVNATTGGDQSWGTPFTLPLTDTHVLTDDIASIIAFRDNGGDKIGIMWSNQLSNTLNFATHDDTNSDAQSGWTLQAAVSAPNSADDHISLRSLQTTSSGQVFAAIKTNATVPSDTLIALLARDVDGSFSVHPYSTVANNDIRPILLIDESANKVYIFVTNGPGGSEICYKAADITTPLSSMSFPSGNCGTAFIQDVVYNRIDNATTTKQNVISTTGIVVLASDDVNGQYYVHNVLGNPPPVVTDRSPERGATDVLVNSVVQATFSKAMNASTLDNTTFQVTRSDGPVAGTVSYDSLTRVATFAPSVLLRANTLHTVTLSAGIQDSTDLPLFGAPEVWSFTTEPPTVQFSALTYSVNEGTASATITVTLNTISSLPVTVTYSTGDGTAVSPGDYTAVTQTLAFNPGQTSQTFSVSIVNDPTDELNETVNLTLSNPVNATLGTPISATLTIADDDPEPTVQFSAASYTVDEVAGAANITVTLSAPSERSVSVDFATGDGTAVDGSDYTGTSGTLDFALGETSQTFTVTILPDTLDEANETMNLTLSGPNAAVLGAPASATLTIVDDDAPPSVQFSDSAYSVDESGGTATVTVTLSAESGQTVMVDYATTGVTAMAGSDYTPVSDTLTFAPGQTSQSFGVTILDDPFDEPDETVFLSLSSPGNATLGGPSGANLTILDNDAPPSVRFSSSGYSVNENQGAATFTVTLSAASGRLVFVNYATSDGSATAGNDYIAVSDTLTFAPGQTSRSFSVTIVNDALGEPNETVNLTLSNPVNAVLGALDTATLTILDSDAPTVQFSSSAYTVDESAGVATITVTLSVPSVFTATVNYATSNGTALAGSDYLTATGMLTFAPGQISQTISVPILSGILAEPDETVILTLSNPSLSTLGLPASATLTILNRDYSIFAPIIMKVVP